MSAKLLVTISEAAEMLGLGRSTVYDLAAQSENGIRIIKVGRAARIRVRDLEEFVERRAAEAVN